MTDLSEIIHCERVLAASWPGRISWAQPAWEIRYADGYTKRANALWIFDPDCCPRSPASFHAWKDWIESRGQPFYVKPPFHPAWDQFLGSWASFRSVEEDPSRVMVLDPLEHSPPLALPKGLEFRAAPSPGTDWLASYAAGTHQSLSTGLGSILQVLGPAGVPQFLTWNTRPVGWVVLSVIGSWAALASFEIAPEYRRQGWGTWLLKGALKEAFDRGARKCLLQVRTGNTPAQNLYKKAGFEDRYGYRYLKFT